MWSRTSILWGVAFVAAALATTSDAFGHRSAPTRSVVVQADVQGLAELWQVEVMGPEAALLWVTADLNRDGTLSHTEETQLAARVLKKAMGDVQRGCGQTREALAPCAPTAVQARLVKGASAGQGPVRAAGLVVIHESTGTRGSSAFALTLTRGGALAVMAQGMGGWKLVHQSVGAIDDERSGSREHVMLSPGQTLVLNWEVPPWRE